MRRRFDWTRRELSFHSWCCPACGAWGFFLEIILEDDIFLLEIILEDDKRVKRGIKAIAVLLIGILLTGCLTGCGANYSKKVAIRVNGDPIYMEEMIVYIYQEEAVYSAYDQLYQSYYGYSFWDSSVDGTTPMSTTVKHELVTMAAWYTILAKEAEAAGMTLDEEETAQVAESAHNTYDSLSDAQKEKMQVTVESLTKTLTKSQLAAKYYVSKVQGYGIDRLAIRAGVSREDYRQYEYEFFAASLTSGSGEDETPLPDDEKKALIERIDSYKAQMEAGEEMEGMLPEDEEDISYNSTSFLDKDKNDSELETFVAEMENGAVANFETEDAYYLIRMINNDSDEAFETEVRSQIQAKENEEFENDYKDVAESCVIKTTRYWNKLKIGELTMDTEEESTEESTEETSSEDTTGESATGEESSSETGSQESETEDTAEESTAGSTEEESTAEATEEGSTTEATEEESTAETTVGTTATEASTAANDTETTTGQ